MTLAEQFKEEGRQEGRQEGVLIGQVRLLQDLFHQPLTPEEILQALSETELRQLLQELKEHYNSRRTLK
ncbi:MAG: hypothetical protein ACFCU3_05285 [Verrucomicrobiales bacterium]